MPLHLWKLLVRDKESDTILKKICFDFQQKIPRISMMFSTWYPSPFVFTSVYREMDNKDWGQTSYLHLIHKQCIMFGKYHCQQNIQFITWTLSASWDFLVLAIFCAKISENELERLQWYRMIVGFFSSPFWHLKSSRSRKNVGINGVIRNQTYCGQPQYELLYAILNNIGVCEQPVSGTMKIHHCAVKFEAGEKNRIVYENLYWWV